MRRRTADQPEKDGATGVMNAARSQQAHHWPAVHVQGDLRRSLRHMMCRHAQRAVMINLAGRMEMRRLNHSAQQHQADAENPKEREPAGDRFGRKQPHATASTIAGEEGKPQTAPVSVWCAVVNLQEAAVASLRAYPSLRTASLARLAVQLSRSAYSDW